MNIRIKTKWKSKTSVKFLKVKANIKLDPK